MNPEMIHCEETILREIADKNAKRLDVAQTYSLALRSSEAPTIDWAKINKAIMDRWSKAGLIWIKQKAWSGKAFETRIGTLNNFPVRLSNE